LFGYSQVFGASYYIPYINRKQKIGLRFAISYNQARNVTYGFANNKDLIYQDIDHFQRRNFYTLVDLIYKPAFNYRYTFTLSYNDNNIKDTIAKLNPDYFLNGQTSQYYFTAQAAFTSDYRDIASYPLKGSFFEVTAAKLGFGPIDNVNIFSTTAAYDRFFQLAKKWYLTTGSKVKFSVPKQQPYNLDKGLGYKHGLYQRL
jgi:hypothetical protein